MKRGIQGRPLRVMGDPPSTVAIDFWTAQGYICCKKCGYVLESIEEDQEESDNPRKACRRGITRTKYACTRCGYINIRKARR